MYVWSGDWSWNTGWNIVPGTVLDIHKTIVLFKNSTELMFMYWSCSIYWVLRCLCQKYFVLYKQSKPFLGLMITVNPHVAVNLVRWEWALRVMDPHWWSFSENTIMIFHLTCDMCQCQSSRIAPKSGNIFLGGLVPPTRIFLTQGLDNLMPFASSSFS